MVRHIRVLLVCGCLTVVHSAVPAPVLAQSAPVQGLGSTDRPRLTEGALRELFTETIADFGRLPSVESATILSIGAIGASIGGQFDTPATTTLSGSSDLGTVLGPGEELGAARTQAVAAVATYAIGRLTNHPRTSAIGADLISAQILTQTTTMVVKMAAGRTRPDGTGFSFPSGHASTAFATATVLQRHLGWKAGIPAYAMATYVAASRIQVKRHFLSDVAFGAAVGIMAGRTVTIGRCDARFAIATAPIPGGCAVNVTWLKH